MKKIEISINPLAEFLVATDSRKKRIIAEQIIPDPVRIPYYQKARAVISKSLLNNLDITQIDLALEFINQKQPTKNWEKSDKVNSKLALEKYKLMNMPELFLKSKLEKISTKAKYLPLFGVNIKISPNCIFRTVINGQKVIGAAKVHVSKNKPFSIQQSAFVAQLLNQFLSNFVAEEDEIVDSSLCICIDPFAGTIVSASNKIKYDMRQLKGICSEISSIWDNENSIDKTEVA